MHSIASTSRSRRTQGSHQTSDSMQSPTSNPSAHPCGASTCAPPLLMSARPSAQRRWRSVCPTTLRPPPLPAALPRCCARGRWGGCCRRRRPPAPHRWSSLLWQVGSRTLRARSKGPSLAVHSRRAHPAARLALLAGSERFVTAPPTGTDLPLLDLRSGALFPISPFPASCPRPLPCAPQPCWTPTRAAATWTPPNTRCARRARCAPPRSSRRTTAAR